MLRVTTEELHKNPGQYYVHSAVFPKPGEWVKTG